MTTLKSMNIFLATKLPEGGIVYLRANKGPEMKYEKLMNQQFYCETNPDMLRRSMMAEIIMYAISTESNGGYIAFSY